MKLLPGNKGTIRNTRKGLSAHGAPTRQTYEIWKSMMHRCYNPKRNNYKNYGGRGIAVSEKWKEFFNFLADMGICPGKGWTLERIDNDKNYEHDNCAWATRKQQMRNMRRNRLLTFSGTTLCVAEWAEKLEIKQDNILDRLKIGWTVDETLTIPIGQRRKQPKKGCYISGGGKKHQMFGPLGPGE